MRCRMDGGGDADADVAAAAAPASCPALPAINSISGVSLAKLP